MFNFLRIRLPKDIHLLFVSLLRVLHNGILPLLLASTLSRSRKDLQTPQFLELASSIPVAEPARCTEAPEPSLAPRCRLGAHARPPRSVASSGAIHQRLPIKDNLWAYI
jgi:hypothetical protein